MEITRDSEKLNTKTHTIEPVARKELDRLIDEFTEIFREESKFIHGF